MKNYFDISKGIFHRGVAHLYALFAMGLCIIAMIIGFMTKGAGPLNTDLIAYVIIPIIITTFLSAHTIYHHQKTYRIYTLLSIGYLLVAVFVTFWYNALFSNAAFKQLVAYNAFFEGNKNALPGSLLNIAIIIILLIISIILLVLSVVLVVRDVKPMTKKQPPKVEIMDEAEAELISETANTLQILETNSENNE